MGISIHFIGICTHVWWDESRPRVVLVNAVEGKRIQEQDIGSHVPTLRIAARHLTEVDQAMVWPGTSDAIIEWQLSGARISINTTGTPQRDDSFLRCMPSLRNLTPDVGAPSPDIDTEVLGLTACLFNITGGTFSAGAIRDNGAVFAKLTAETEGPPALSIAAYGSEVPSLIGLKDGAEITIANLGATEGHDGSLDFYLHYMLAATMPDVLGVPKPPGPNCRVNAYSPTWPKGFGTVDAGCSNSAYP